MKTSHCSSSFTSIIIILYLKVNCAVVACLKVNCAVGLLVACLKVNCAVGAAVVAEACAVVGVFIHKWKLFLGY